MKKMRLLAVLSCILAVSVLSGCVTQKSERLEAYDIPANATVLGPVHVEMKKKNTYSYADFLKEAQKKYPRTQEVVHIQIDAQSNNRYLLHGIAICY